MITSTLLLFALAAPEIESGDVQTTLDALAQSAREYVPAKVIERTAPKYPGTELRKGKEGWVRVAYCIDESGDTRNVAILDSIGGPRFDKSAVETVEAWKFEPALVDGEPSWQSRNQVYISFALKGDNKQASSRFVRQFKKFNVFIKRKELEKADELFWKVLDEDDLNLYELSKLWAQRVRYEGIKGDMYGLDKALHRATASNGQWIQKEDYHRLLKLRIQVEIKIGQYGAAVEGFDDLVKSAGESSEEVRSLRPMMEQLQETIDSDEAFKIEALVRTRDRCNSCDNSWCFTPVRDSFALTNISGNLSTIDMRCDHKRFESDVSDQVEWSIPESWGDCHIDIYGEPGTTFDLVMLPASK